MQQQSTSLCDTKYKIVFLGDMGVGKTSIIERFVKDQFDSFNNPTVGIDFLTRNITYQSKTYRLQLWDTAGQQKYKSLVPAYLRDANCAVFVFDFTRKQTFADLPNWIQLYRDHASEMSVGFIIGINLIKKGNKCDLIEQQKNKQINSVKELSLQLEQQALQFARKQNMTFRKVSAKTGKDILNSFQNILLQLQRENKKGENTQEQDPQTKFENEVLQKMQKLKLQDVKKGKVNNCCYI